MVKVGLGGPNSVAVCADNVALRYLGQDQFPFGSGQHSGHAAVGPMFFGRVPMVELKCRRVLWVTSAARILASSTEFDAVKMRSTPRIPL